MKLNIKEIKAVVFDCDGVMFDTADANRMYYNEVLEHFGKKKLTDEQFVKVHMFTVKEALEYLFPEMDSLYEVYNYMTGVGYPRFISYMKIEPGLRQLLKVMKSKGYIRAVATNRTDTMPSVLKEHKLENQFDMVVTAADVKKPKPEPDQLIKIMEEFELEPFEIIFIGDSQYDAMASFKAGTFFIAFKNDSLKADFHVDSMEEIGQILDIV